MPTTILEISSQVKQAKEIYLKSFLCNVISRFFSPVFPSRCKRPPNKGFDNPHRQLLQKK